MKRLLPLLALGTSLLASAALAADKPAEAPKPQKLVKIASLNTIEANTEFQRNVQIVQAQRQGAIELNTAMEKEKDPKKKAELKKQLDEALAKLNENNSKMAQTYGFSLTRNYTMEVEKAHIYMLVSEEEAAQMEKNAAEQAKKDAKKK